ncbi:MAG: hypothetical protein U9N77_04575 [Thermodesulfobacteriota bacterium]|nr:hypothetical protein [Thermodesulfobacteriota bacterium]
MLKNRDFKQGFSQWQISKQQNGTRANFVPGIISLSSSSLTRGISAKQNIDFSHKNPILRLQGSLRCKGVVEW